MKKIYKYTLELCHCQLLSMPKDSVILSAQMQRNALCLWALCNPDSANEERHIRIFGTGHDVPTLPLKFIDTIQEGWLVWHIFEETFLT